MRLDSGAFLKAWIQYAEGRVVSPHRKTYEKEGRGLGMVHLPPALQSAAQLKPSSFLRGPLGANELRWCRTGLDRFRSLKIL